MKRRLRLIKCLGDVNWAVILGCRLGNESREDLILVIMLMILWQLIYRLWSLMWQRSTRLLILDWSLLNIYMRARIAHPARSYDHLYVLRQGLHGDSWMNILDNLMRVIVRVLAINIIQWGHISYSNLIGQHWWIRNQKSRLTAADYLGCLINNKDWLILCLVISYVLMHLKIGSGMMHGAAWSWRMIQCSRLPILQANHRIRLCLAKLTFWKIVSKSWISAEDLIASSASILMSKILRGIILKINMWETRYIRVCCWHQIIMILRDMFLHYQISGVGCWRKDLSLLWRPLGVAETLASPLRYSRDLWRDYLIGYPSHNI
jgi:hypothetical protein